MAKLARDVMTTNPACCTPQTPLDQVAKLMVQHDCGEIPVIDPGEHVVGVVTDRDIVTRVIAKDKNPLAYTAESAMSDPAITVPTDAPLNEVLATMEKHQIRRVPVINEQGCCAGMISQSDLAWSAKEKDVAELVREVSRETGAPSR